MTAGDKTPAREVEGSVSELWKKREPGTFVRGGVHGHEGSISLFLVLPNGAIGSVKNMGSQPTWTIVQNEDGTYTVTPSIYANPGSLNPNEPEWHGYLTDGVFTEV
jgi:hypothetical protein